MSIKAVRDRVIGLSKDIKALKEKGQIALTERQMKIVERLKFQDPDLYATIQFGNPYTKEALKNFMRHAQGLMQAIETGDKEEFLRVFKKVQRFGR